MAPAIVDRPTDLRTRVRTWRAAGERVALVPTMGNLHAGHLALIDAARAAADRVVASVFVNPLQFGPDEDYAAYPRTLTADAEALGSQGVDLVFAPTTATLYPEGEQAAVRIQVPDLEDILCGRDRPGHFGGVATVVAKLFNIAEPDVAVFGEKDFQQLLVIRQLVAGLNWPIEIIGGPTVREADGLATSSRNGYLAAAERARAPALIRNLRALADRLASGERDYAALETAGAAGLDAAGLQTHYVAIRRAADLGAPAPTAALAELRILGAAQLGNARLIDNIAATATSA